MLSLLVVCSDANVELDKLLVRRTLSTITRTAVDRPIEHGIHRPEFERRRACMDLKVLTFHVDEGVGESGDEAVRTAGISLFRYGERTPVTTGRGDLSETSAGR